MADNMGEPKSPHATTACGAPGNPITGPQVSKGTVPEGAVDERDASRKVREMFTQIAPRYDLLNHLLSLEMDRLWRARTAKILQPILERPEARILDLCCGTGDLAFAMQRRAKGRVWGADFAHTMLMRARQKAEGPRAAPQGAQSKPEEEERRTVAFVESDALRLPFADQALDLVSAAFGFRNLANYEDGLREIWRVLKPGGTIAILEFTEPRPGWFGDLYRWYFRSVLPRLGGLISGDRRAYTYLPKSVARFFQPEEFSALIEQCGFQEVRALVWTGGTIALHTGVKSS
jgi:demethylmenaquinone methyltransferase/2-methoxy-6-polyprenyl-1,4-benzoquinol methylase